MLNKTLLTALYVLIFSICFSQSVVYTDIQENQKKYPNKDYVFYKVIDARKNKDNIGIVYKSDINQQYLADLHDPLDVAIMRFLNTTFPNGEPSKKITVVINNFEIGHKLSGKKNDTGFVSLNFDFYKEENDVSVLIHNYTGTLVDYNDNIALTHSNRIKRAILLSVAKLDLIVLNSLELTQNNNAPQIIPDSIKTIATNYTKENIEASGKDERCINCPRKVIFMLGGHALFATESKMYGANVNVVFRLKSQPKSLIGLNVNYSAIKFDGRNGVPLNTSYQLRTSDFGFRFLRQIKGFFFYNFNPHLMIGRETFVVDNGTIVYVNNGNVTNVVQSKSTTEKTFIGAQFDNGIYIMSPKNAGAYFGTDLFFRETNSSVFGFDMGLKLNLGIAF